MKVLARPETSIPIKCNQHPWMRAYVHVVQHPFHAVTGEDGSFELKGLPPGEYEIEAVHEQYGAQTMQVSVAANGSATAEFTFSRSQAYRPGSLEMAPGDRAVLLWRGLMLSPLSRWANQVVSTMPLNIGVERSGAPLRFLLRQSATKAPARAASALARWSACLAEHGSAPRSDCPAISWTQYRRRRS